MESGGVLLCIEPSELAGRRKGESYVVEAEEHSVKEECSWHYYIPLRP